MFHLNYKSTTLARDKKYTEKIKEKNKGGKIELNFLFGLLRFKGGDFLQLQFFVQFSVTLCEPDCECECECV